MKQICPSQSGWDLSFSHLCFWYDIVKILQTQNPNFIQHLCTEPSHSSFISYVLIQLRKVWMKQWYPQLSFKRKTRNLQWTKRCSCPSLNWEASSSLVSPRTQSSQALYQWHWNSWNYKFKNRVMGVLFICFWILSICKSKF